MASVQQQQQQLSSTGIPKIMSSVVIKLQQVRMLSDFFPSCCVIVINRRSIILAGKLSLMLSLRKMWLKFSCAFTSGARRSSCLKECCMPTHHVTYHGPGVALFNLSAFVEGNLFTEALVRVKPANGQGLPHHRFRPGDLVTLCRKSPVQGDVIEATVAEKNKNNLLLTVLKEDVPRDLGKGTWVRNRSRHTFAVVC